MFRNRKALVVVLGLVALATLLIGCAAAEEKVTPTIGGQTAVSGTATMAATAKPKSGGTLNLSLSSDPTQHDPQRDVSISPFWQRIGNQLVGWEYGPGSEYYDITPTPDLAESWEVSADGLIYTLHLRQGVKWQNKPPVNGRELVAADVKFTFDRLFRVSKYLYGYQLGDVKSVEAPDKYTVVFTLGQIYAPFLTHLGNYWATILPPEVEEKVEGSFADVKGYVGTGPFTLENYQVNVSANFVKNPTYFRSPLPYVDNVRTVIVSDSSTREAALRAGNLDIVGVSATNLKSLQNTNPELQLHVAQGTLYGWAIAMRSDKPPFSDVRVRQAVALAIDRKGWVEALYLGEGIEDNGALPAGMKAWKLPTDQLGEGAKYFTYDPAEAKRLLAEAGYPNGFETQYITYGTSYADAADLIVDYLSKVGIKVNIKVMDYGAWLASVSSSFGEWSGMEGMSISTQWAVLDPDLTLYGFYHPTVATNITHTRDPKLTEMMEKQRTILDFIERKKVVDEIQRYLAVQNYRIPVPYPYGHTFQQPWVKDYYPKVWGLSGRIYEHVWLDK